MHRRTGHRAEAFHVGPKIFWLRAHRPDVFRRTARFLQPRDVVLHRLTGEVLTDETHANATLLFDLRRRRWDAELLAAFDLDPALFPPAVPAWTEVARLPARTARETGLERGLPVVIGAADSQCAAFGAGVVDTGPGQRDGRGVVLPQLGRRRAAARSPGHPLQPRRPGALLHRARAEHHRRGHLLVGATARLHRVRRAGRGGPAAPRSGSPAGGRRPPSRTRRCSCPSSATASATIPGPGPPSSGCPTGTRGRRWRSPSWRASRSASARRSAVLERAGSPVQELRVGGGGAHLAVLGRIKADVLGRPVRHLDVDPAAMGAAMLAGEAAGVGPQAREAIARAVRRAPPVRAEPGPAGVRGGPPRLVRAGPPGPGRARAPVRRPRGREPPMTAYRLGVNTCFAVKRWPDPRVLGAAGRRRARRGPRPAQPGPGRPARGPGGAAVAGRGGAPGVRPPRPQPALDLHRARRLLGEPAAAPRPGLPRPGRGLPPPGRRLHRRLRRGFDRGTCGRVQRGRLGRPGTPRGAGRGAARAPVPARRLRPRAGPDRPAGGEPRRRPGAVHDGGHARRCCTRATPDGSRSSSAWTWGTTAWSGPAVQSGIRTPGRGGWDASRRWCSCSRPTAWADHHWPFTAATNEHGVIRRAACWMRWMPRGPSDIALILEVIPAFEADDDAVVGTWPSRSAYWREALDERERG